MSSLAFRRTTLVLLLVTLLTAPLASAAGRQAQPKAAPVPSGLFSRAWSLLASLWGETGCNVDPNGRCGTRSVQVRTDTGCTGDPDGHCVTRPIQVHTDTGCTGDPNGRCTP